MSRSLQLHRRAFVATVVVCAIAATWFWWSGTSDPLASALRPSEQSRIRQYIDEELPSRTWMRYAKSVVQDHEYPPAQAARIYAYIASAYSDVYDATDDKRQAMRAPWYVITHLYPYTKRDATLLLVAIQDNSEVTLSPKATEIVDAYKKRWDEKESHGHPDVVIPTRKDLWIPVTEKGAHIDPLDPNAGSWPRWIITNDTFDMPAPPAVGSAKDAEEIQKMKDSLAQREAWRERIFIWWGGKGTGTPSWQWQDIMYDVAAGTMDDKAYARYQKNLAQALADTFIICWDEKFIYWSARPWMRIPGFKPIAETPPFPGYPSGHSTVSASAAVVLGAWFPEHAADFMAMAEEAHDTRLYAGIHFEIDNTEGFALGKRIGERLLEKIDIRK